MRRVVRWTGQKPRLWDPATGELQRTEGDNPRFSSILGVTFSPDGRLLATCWTDNTVRLWDLATGVLQRTFEHTQRYVIRVHGVTCSPDGRLLASWGDDETVRLWDLTRPACHSNYARPSGRAPAPG